MNNAAFPIFDEIDRLKVEIDALRPLDPELEQRVMDKLRLDWNYNSNAIEGNTLTLGETKIFLLEGLTAKGKPLKDHLDIKGHDEAIDFLLDFVRNKEAFTEKDIRAFHQVLLKEPYEMPSETPDGRIIKRTIEIGRYKTMPNHVRTSTGKIHYYATPEETPARMQELMDWYRNEEEKGDLHPVLISTLFHHRFTEIHPFDDGNGRMARILSNLILMRHSYPPIIVRQAKRDEYLYVLRQADEGEYESLVEFMGAELINSMDLYLRGARGEDISELGDFDKRVALLKQRLETSVVDRSEKSIEGQVRLFNQLIRPLFEKLSPHSAGLDPLFTKHSSEVKWSKDSDIMSRTIRKRRGLDLSFLLGDLKRQEVLWVRKVDKWEDMRARKPGTALTLETSFDLDENSFLCAYSISGETHDLIDGPYNSTFSEDEIEQLAVKILDNLYKKIESLSG